MASIGKRTRGGAEVRILNVEADAGKGHGLFEDLHGYQSPADLSRVLKSRSKCYYGAPFRAFVRRLVNKKEPAVRFLRKVREVFLDRFVPENASGELRRAAERFVLVAGVGELATIWGLTGWKRGEAIRAASMFEELAEEPRRGGIVRYERGGMPSAGFLPGSMLPVASTWSSSQDHLLPGDDPIIREQAGFIKCGPDGEMQYLIFPQVFRKEVCAGFSPLAVARELEERHLLIHDPDELTTKTRIHGLTKTMRLFSIRSSILEGDEV